MLKKLKLSLLLLCLPFAALAAQFEADDQYTVIDVEKSAEPQVTEFLSFTIKVGTPVSAPSFEYLFCLSCIARSAEIIGMLAMSLSNVALSIPLTSSNFLTSFICVKGARCT